MKKSVLGGYIPTREVLDSYIQSRFSDSELTLAIQIVRALISHGLDQIKDDHEYTQDYQDGFDLFGFAVFEMLDKVQAILDGGAESINEMYYFEDVRLRED